MPASEKYLKFRMCELTRPPIFKTLADKKIRNKNLKLMCFFNYQKNISISSYKIIKNILELDELVNIQKLSFTKYMIGW